MQKICNDKKTRILLPYLKIQNYAILLLEGEIQSAKSSGTRSLAERMERAQSGCKRSEC